MTLNFEMGRRNTTKGQIAPEARYWVRVVLPDVTEQSLWCQKLETLLPGSTKRWGDQTGPRGLR